MPCGNPDVGGVRPVIHDHKVDQRVRIGPDPSIADHHRAAAMANGDGGNLVLHRTGVGINVNGRHDRTKGQSADAQGKVMWPAGLLPCSVTASLWRLFTVRPLVMWPIPICNRLRLQDKLPPPDIETGTDCQRAAEHHHAVDFFAEDDDADGNRE